MYNDFKVIMIYASDFNGCIGKNNTIPWKLRADMKFFRETTTGHPVIMGRKTAESLGCKPLPNRQNWVLSRSEETRRDMTQFGFLCESELEEILGTIQADQQKQAFIIGGAEIYRLALGLNLVDEIYHTVVDTVVEGGDTFLSLPPHVAGWGYELVMSCSADDRNEHSFSISRRFRK